MRRNLLLLVFLALLAALAAGLCGCALRGQEQDTPGEVALPEPTEEPVNMILGETLSNGFNNVTLSIAAQDGTGFSTVTRSIRTDADQSLPEAAIRALLESLEGASMRSIGDTRMLSFEYTCGTATVNLSIDARNVQSAQDLLALEASIGNTLLNIGGVRGVNVLIGDLSESFCQLPLGVQTEPVISVAAAYAQLQAERERQSELNSEPLERSALMYYPTTSGRWFIPELRTIHADADGFVTALIEALKEGPQRESCAVSSIPEGVELLDDHPTIRTTDRGERILDLNFSSTLVNYMAFSGLEIWELAGSLSLTMCSFLPELDAVRIMVNSDPITICETDERILSFPDGLIRRRDFSGKIGSAATLYLVNDEAKLEPVQSAVSMRSALSPRSLLTELMRHSGSGNTSPCFPIPDGVYPEDLLGVQTFGGVARVNLSAAFYRNCQVLGTLDERSVVYSMVNTLCHLDGIRGVRFYVEGRAAETLAGSIYLKSVLMPNPGINRSS